ncbi:ArnT family glycosyltransferase [Aquisphaera insulae]|uniref:ArnT family glycosyltransferase n=1 Tax=Aquisphaera insulae TaxID=2712864 RepID=UPI0013ECB92C|nr:phospholipid carrier-dependent glycosyltransferase [Aquisphaera insulae]
MSESPPPSPAGPTTPARFTSRIAAVVTAVAAIVFAAELNDKPFVDEYAYITQSYQPDLLLDGKRDDPHWLEFLSFDLVPVPKYMINAAFRATGTPRPTARDALGWYQNTESRWKSRRELIIARLPFVCSAAAGCAAMYLLASLAIDPTIALLAAGMLAINPLYRLHAHRAMSESPCETFLMLALLIGLTAWTRWWSARGRATTAWILWILTGVAAGLSVLAKFNGLLALFTLASWGGLGLLAPHGASPVRRAGLIAGIGLAVAVAAATFLALNPFMTARPGGPLPPAIRSLAEQGPWSRFRFLIDQRRSSSSSQQTMFPHNALVDPIERVKVVVVQGFGRFGLFGAPKSDSTIRYDVQDLGALLWLPLVLAGVIRAIRLGMAQLAANEPPTALALVLWAAVTLAVVTVYIPMAWDRYLLPIQAPLTLLAAIPVREALARVKP